MSTITDLRRERKRRNRKRMLKTLLVVVLLVAAAAGSVFVYEKYLKNGDSLPGLQQNELDISSSSTGSGSSGGIALSGGQPQGIYSFDGSIAVLTQTEFAVYSTGGKNTLSYKHGFNKPQVHITGSYALLYDVGGKKTVLLSKNKVVREQEFEHSILCAAVSKDGYLGIAAGASSFGTQFSVYDTTQTEIFKWYTSDYQILSLSFLDSKGAVAGCVGAQNGEKRSILYTFQFDKQEPLAKTEVPGSLVLATDCSSGQAFAVADNQCLVMKGKGEIIGEYAYGDNFPTMIAKTSGTYRGVVLQRYANNREMDLVVLDKACKKKVSIPVSDVRDIYLDTDKIYVLSDVLTCYDLAGNKLSEQTVDGSAHKITLVNGRIYLCTLSSLERVQMEAVTSSHSE